jgi:hypothetical protein
MLKLAFVALGFLLGILAAVCALWVLLRREIDDLTRNE